MAEEGPRDRAVSLSSKQALVQTRGEGAKELAFTNRPFRRTAEQVMAQITKVFAKVLRPVSECFYDIERLGKCEDTRQPQQELLPHSMAGS